MRNIFLLITCLLVLSCSKNKARIKNFNNTVGVYNLDLKRTKLGVYEKDSLSLKELQITFYRDSTFKLNMAVPFIFEESGKWISDGGDFESWNWLSYKTWLKEEPIRIGKGNQFTLIYNDKNDSIFYINGATPKHNMSFIQEIYFKKVMFRTH